MRLLLLSLLTFTLSVFPQNIKKVKLFLNNDANLQKAYSLAIDFEEVTVDKEGGYILFVNENEFHSIVN